MEQLLYKAALGEDGLPIGGRTQVGVYGTLKDGFKRHNILGLAKKYLGIAYAEGLLIHLGEHPMLVRQNPECEFRPDNRVAIQVFEIETMTLRTLDGVEGHPYYFQREIVKTEYFGDVFVYYGKREDYLLGIVDVISGNQWQGENSFSVEVNFKDGKTKPHFKAIVPPATTISLPPQVGGLVNTETGEVIGIPNRVIEVPKSEIIEIPKASELNSPWSKIVNL